MDQLEGDFFEVRLIGKALTNELRMFQDKLDLISNPKCLNIFVEDNYVAENSDICNVVVEVINDDVNIFNKLTWTTKNPTYMVPNCALLHQLLEENRKLMKFVDTMLYLSKKQNNINRHLVSHIEQFDKHHC